MILWLQRNRLQSSILISAAALFGFGGIDLILDGPLTLITSALLAAGLFASRYLPWAAVSAVIAATAFNLIAEQRPGFSGAIALLIVASIAAFGDRLWALISLGVSMFAGLTIVTFFVVVIGLSSFDISTYGPWASWNLVLFGVALVASTSILAYLVGRLAITVSTHVGTSVDRVVSDREQARLALQIAEQDARFEIAKDISELVIQRLTAAVSLADGASFALRGESELGERALAQVGQSARQAHIELRRLYDMLNKQNRVNAAPPRIGDLAALIPMYRELGYNIMLNQAGRPLELEEGLELAVYRIIFDALENVQTHVPVGADVTVDFAWTEGGLQVLVKDNGVEVANRTRNLAGNAYEVSDDHRSLVETITGAGLTSMRERAALYGGSIEATRVPGVGFTLSLILPRLNS
ncbi:MAG: sensor histidine kinase [Rhodoluna sp.]